MDPNNSDTQDIVETATTENNSEVSQEPEGQQEPEQTSEVEQTEEEKAKAAAEAEEKKRSRAKERIERLARENAELRKFKEEAEAKAKQPAQTDEAPKVEDFEDYSEFQQAQQEWFIKQAEQRVLDKLNQEKSSQQKVQAEAEYQTAVAELESEGVDVNGLIEKANSLPPLPVTLDQFGLPIKDTLGLAKKIIEDEDLYYELTRMNPYQAAMKIGQIIGSQKPAPKAPKVPNAPKPINPTSANAPVKRDMDKMSDNEFLKSRGL
ncbi:hypothetical protein [Acinetobacter baumannii]|uniref:hypothetical protein n=1 Tax=Acinetobacter baumannii TaxID=470 RepID=UPI000DE60744|nr:hypothetical protein [Acinetobacter baumannii]MCJ8876889.1 hypothetical protein [Acinetobacter baumannii]MCJ8917256.1 hypothetical protein [Acinetobacter baumannii]MCJ8979627.1 hypothetical protein [Acinetobacter baumannii]MCJ9283396.1 hypothetical protein [Acinetobacter baumannii]MCJ9316100.1 hypothetical protein [Acinetobacter baumannii]